MKNYEYKFVQVPVKSGFKVKAGDTYEVCKGVIIEEAQQGWRLKQVVVPFNEKTGVYGASSYEVIFEREIG
ncbi:MAG: DUF4177 domain-containing protein [Cellulosilyticaceae bacterium]